jgi:hypothetical protein
MCLNTFGCGRDAKAMGQGSYRTHDIERPRVLGNVSHERPVDLDLVEWEPLQLSDEYPVTKSSIATPVPSWRSWNSIENVTSLSCRRTFSVISSSRRSGRRPKWPSALATTWIKPGLLNWAGDRLTAIFRLFGHRAAVQQAWRSVHSPSGTMRPICFRSSDLSFGSLHGGRSYCPSSTKAITEN